MYDAMWNREILLMLNKCAPFIHIFRCQIVTRQVSLKCMTQFQVGIVSSYRSILTYQNINDDPALSI